MSADFKLTEQQSSAVDMVKKHAISVLFGGPGTGKTFTIKEIISWARGDGLKVIQACPTGRGAKRMIEATGEYASTIHTMLGCVFSNNKFAFIHDEHKPLPCDLLILDEVSMITNSLMNSVLKAIDVTSTKVLLVGDANQLPSVEAGAVLRDILASKAIPHVELDVVHRNAGSIVTSCHKIKSGIVYSPATQLDLDAESPVNLVHIERDDPESTLDTIEALVCDRMSLRGYEPINDVQVISPVNDKGLLSCKSINERLRDRLNPTNQAKDDDEFPFRIGDKVINTKNLQYQHVFGKKETAEHGTPNTSLRKIETGDITYFTKQNGDIATIGETMIVNGDIGFVSAIIKKDMLITFKDPDRTVIFPKKEKKHLKHAYCITCHRFQGSEAPVIIIPVHRQFDRFLSNPWIYTAISRGKEIVVTCGKFDSVARAIRNRTPNNRRTKLAEKIRDNLQHRRQKEYNI